MKNGKKLGKNIAKGIVKFGKGMKEAYAEEYGVKPKKKKVVKTATTKKTTKRKEGKTLKITLTNPVETISGKWEVWWGVKKLVQHKDFKTRPPATKFITELKGTWRAKGYKIDYMYLK